MKYDVAFKQICFFGLFFDIRVCSVSLTMLFPRVVRCKWLAASLGVDAGTSKRMMTRFLDAHRAKTDADADVAATFCVAGEAADPSTGNAQIRLRIVGEDRVDQVKKTLTKVIGVYVYRFLR